MTPITKFEQFVRDAFQAFPKRLRDSLDNVAIVIEPSPRSAKSREIPIIKGGILLGLYEGIPQPAWGRRGSGILPDKITLFQKPIERLAPSEPHLRELIREVLWHELGHHFGFTDAQLRRIESRRKFKK
jgi:predicted Zn-dependent protease with MMP-like domain